MKERVVLGSFSMCWEGEDGADLSRVLREHGFTIAPPKATTPLYFRQESGTTILFASYYGLNSAGNP